MWQAWTGNKRRAAADIDVEHCTILQSKCKNRSQCKLKYHLNRKANDGNLSKNRAGKAHIYFETKYQQSNNG